MIMIHDFEFTIESITLLTDLTTERRWQAARFTMPEFD